MADGDEIKEFKIEIRSGEVGVLPTSAFEQRIPPYPLNLDNLRAQTIQALTMMLREDRLASTEELRVLGSHLAAVLFYSDEGKYNPVGAALEEFLERYRQKDVESLRVELEFAENHPLSSWPWEYLYCAPTLASNNGNFLASYTRLVLARRLQLTKAPSPLIIEQLPIRVLFVASSPRDLEVEYDGLLEMLRDQAYKVNRAWYLREWKNSSLYKNMPVAKLIADAIKGELALPDTDVPDVSKLRQDFIEITALIAEEGKGEPVLPTSGNFQRLVKLVNPHVIHFVGHGRYQNGDGELAFTGPDREPEWIRGEMLGMWLDSMNAPRLRLVLLQACESARSDMDGPYRAISGVANHLAGRNIPAVVGMQCTVKQLIAISFAGTFYAELLAGKPVEMAVQAGRSQIRESFDKWANSRAFGLPVLFMHGSGALLPKLTSQPNAEADDRRSLSRPGVPDSPPRIPTGPLESGQTIVPSQFVICYNEACNSENDPNVIFCEECGTMLKCQKCGHRFKRKPKKFCGGCSADLGGTLVATTQISQDDRFTAQGSNDRLDQR